MLKNTTAMLVANREPRASFSPAITWRRVGVVVVNTAVRAETKEHPLVVFDAMARQAMRGLRLKHVLVRTPGVFGPALTLRLGARYVLELLLIEADDTVAAEFCRAFRDRLFSFEVDGRIELEQVHFEPPPPPESSEIRLDFTTPLPLRSNKGRLVLTGQELSSLLCARVKAIFDVDVRPPAAEHVQVLTDLSTYRRFRHMAKSQAGVMWLHGHVGPLVVRGDFRQLWPLLCLCERIGLGRKLAFGMGQFTIEAALAPIRV
jgi:hypothetical protein